MSLKNWFDEVHMQIQENVLNLYSVKSYAHPWQHYIVDDLFDDATLRKIQNKILSEKIKFKTLPEDPEEIQFAIFPDIELAKYILSSDFKSYLEAICKERLSLYAKGALQLRRMTPLSPEFPAHVDFIEEKTLVMLIYLSPNWSPEKGGELILQSQEKSEISECKIIEPIENRMVLFMNDPQYWHAVRKVHNWDRYLVMAEWIVQ